ncbi:TRAP transporter large permease [Microbaculum marinisediminis]|uniref:TRAP transporter large permease protein n=1 Tax=Microbaculum marinisediminis TaxID=2931392 RepID=A0AAW5R2V8_9HYPH|nr:TRAP transporter large permease [Microbaculum sp. A6E488]MCT8973705.1 TRAP transporter large permease [Microbaculum sp. A6E488]
MTEFVIGLVALVGFILIRIPVALAMGIIGFVGYAHYMGFSVSSKMVAGSAFELGSYMLTVIPLFVLMGNFVASSGLGRDLFRAAYAFIGRMPGGLAISAILASGGFAAISGSSVASAATMAKVSYPPMRSFGYSESFSLATIAAGGTLGILIPPSVVLIIYGILAEQNIAKLFLAGIVPGLLGMVLYTLAVGFVVARDRDAGPRGEYVPWSEKWRALREVWGVIALFVLVMGGLYGGVFTATEGAGIGASGALLLTWIRGAMTLAVLRDAFLGAVRTTGALFPILLGSTILGNFIAMTGAPETLADWIGDIDPHPAMLLFIVVLLYLFLGFFFESFSTLFITMPIILPLIDAAGFDLIWFGIIVVVTIEIGLLTPPFGMNVFVLTSVFRNIAPGPVFRALIPFIVADFIRVALLALFPALVLFLPSQM